MCSAHLGVQAPLKEGVNPCVCMYVCVCVSMHACRNTAQRVHVLLTASYAVSLLAGGTLQVRRSLR